MKVIACTCYMHMTVQRSIPLQQKQSEFFNCTSYVSTEIKKEMPFIKMPINSELREKIYFAWLHNGAQTEISENNDAVNAEHCAFLMFSHQM